MHSEVFSFRVYNDQYAITFSSINMFLKGPDDFPNCHLPAYAGCSTSEVIQWQWAI